MIPGRSGTDNRLFLEAVLWMVRTGAPWRDLPELFGSWNSVFRRFRRWAQAGVFERLFQVLSGDPDFEYALIDGTIIRVHQHGTGAKGGLVRQAIGRSRGGLTTKIVALVDALGNLVRFVLLPGQRHDSVGAEPLLEGIEIERSDCRQGLRQSMGCARNWMRVARPPSSRPKPTARAR